VFVLTKKDLDEVLTHYPQIRKKILETAEERQRMVAERAKALAKKKEEDKKRETMYFWSMRSSTGESENSPVGSRSIY